MEKSVTEIWVHHGSLLGLLHESNIFAIPTVSTLISMISLKIIWSMEVILKGHLKPGWLPYGFLNGWRGNFYKKKLPQTS